MTAELATSVRQPSLAAELAGLRTAFTVAEIAEIAGSTTRSAQNWVAGRNVPDTRTQDRLVRAAYAVELLSDVFHSEGVRIWFHKPQRVFGHRRPLDLLVEGRFGEINEAIDRLAGGPRLP